MRKEYDFSTGERGKFYRRGAELNIPVYLEPDVAKAVRERARKKDASIGVVVNEWLRKDIQLFHEGHEPPPPNLSKRRSTEELVLDEVSEKELRFFEKVRRLTNQIDDKDRQLLRQLVLYMAQKLASR